MKMASLKDISERYKRVCESFIKKTVKTGLKDKGDSVFKLPENYIEIALMKIIESRGIEEVDIDCSEILEENPDKSKWVPTLVYIDTDDTLGVRWDKFLAYNTECGCIDVYEDTDTYESFYGQDEYVQKELYREVIDALGMEYVEPETMYYQTLESFVGHVSRKRSSDLVSDIDYPDGVYILHETLGVCDVEGWNPNDNNGVVGILVVEDEHKIVVALEDSPENLHWSKKNKLVNASIGNYKDAESDFNGENHCIKLNSPDFPAAYYCLNYKKGGLDWYLPSAGELWLIYRHLKKIQIALKTVKGKKLVPDYANFLEDAPCYWSSTESNDKYTWALYLNDGLIRNWGIKVRDNCKVRPVSNFNKNKNLKESFTRKTSKTKDEELRTRADESVLPKNYIDLALMSVLCSAKKEGICFRKPKFRFKDDFGDVYELSEIFLQNDGFEIGSYEQNHYLEVEWDVYENGYMEEEPVSDYYPFKDEDDEIKIEIYKRVLQYLDMEYVSPNIRWMEFDDEGFDYFDN